MEKVGIEQYSLTYTEKSGDQLTPTYESAFDVNSVTKILKLSRE